MDWFNNLNIFKKIAIISVIAIATLIFTTLSAFLAQQENQTSLVKLESTIAPLLLISGENVVLLERVDEVYSQSVSFGDSDLKANAESTLDKLKSNLNRVKALDKDHASAVSAIQERLDRYRTTTSTIVDAMLSGGDVDFDKIGKLSGEKSALLEQSLSDLRQYSARIDDQFKGLLGQIRDSSSQSLTNTVLFGIISCGLMIVITVFVGRKISDTVNNLAQSLSELAHGEGDLNHKLPVESNDELGQVASNFNHFMTLLKDAISHVIDVTNPLSRSSTTLISHTQDARDAAVKQSSDTENAQNLIRELQSSVNEIVESANQAAQLVSDVSSESENGIRVVNQTIQVSGELDHDIQEAAATVQELANDSENVHSILDVINSIADQTNLLALNAAIEAARAGDQGRGFAVVADEVRALASKTAESTTEIRQVLEQLRSAASNSTSRMKTASEKSKLNQQHAISTGNALEQIKEKISHLSEVNSQIAAATEHQNDATRHVVSNIEDVTAAFNVTTQTFSDVEGIARQLHQFSDQLQEASSRFKV